MDCRKFQDTLSDYLEGSVDSRARAESAAHRLVCRECRELYNDVRATINTLNTIANSEVDEPLGLESRIIARTTAGEMLSCADFDKLIERYFDGVILAPTFQTFQAHFEKCAKCRRLMSGIEEAIITCREIKETEVEMPVSLHDRIVEATLGRQVPSSWVQRARLALIDLAAPLWTPQIAVAALIFSASSFLILSRFGSVSGMAMQAETQAEFLVNQGQRAINQTGAIAKTGFSLLFDSGPPKTKPSPVPVDQPNKTPSPQQDSNQSK
jgi:predicted anti-sigma-YlaC factor YlaD